MMTGQIAKDIGKFMDKRYQVFVSSTFTDLENERREIIQTLMEMDCIPAGMELFPAADEEQWEFIKRVIDDCDYYILIIGGRYGSIADDGLSYTEKEFDYAVSKGIKVIALLHDSPDELPGKHLEKDQTSIQKLQKFRDKVKDGRLVRHWNKPDQLSGAVSLSLNKTIKMYPAVGWVRANSTASPQLLAEINDLRKDNDGLRVQLDESKTESTNITKTELADFDSKFMLIGTYYWSSKHGQYSQDGTSNWNKTTTWAEIFTVVSPFLSTTKHESKVAEFISSYFCDADRDKYYVSSEKLDIQVLFTLRIQLIALNLIAFEPTTSNWHLTDLGEKQMIKSRVIRNKKSSDEPND